MNDDFLYRDLRVVGKRVHRLGIASNYGIDGRGFAKALERGINYVFWASFRSGQVTPVLKQHLAKHRESMVIATGASPGWFAGNYRRGLESALKELGTDYIDVFQMNWLGVYSAYTDSVLDELRRLKEEGKIRSIGTSIHDRVRAGKLAEDSPIDLFMIRYNAAHPGAERDIFPHLAKRQPAVVAYTATAWKKLLKRPSGWTGKIASAGDCYRFCLNSQHVDVVLSGPASEQQFDENLAAVEQGALADDEMTWMRELGEAAHG
jgi:aryl-alcohol dehydrogenase-like predicted oxidoreductase